MKPFDRLGNYDLNSGRVAESWLLKFIELLILFGPQRGWKKFNRSLRVWRSHQHDWTTTVREQRQLIEFLICGRLRIGFCEGNVAASSENRYGPSTDLGNCTLLQQW